MHRSKKARIRVAFLLTLLALLSAEVGSGKEANVWECEGKYVKKIPPPDELELLLRAHREWLDELPIGATRMRETDFAAWLDRHPLTKADPRRANLCGAELGGVALGGRFLDIPRRGNYSFEKGRDLSGADLRHANLSGANLMHVSLRGANLARSNLLRADMRGADLIDASLNAAFLIDTDLKFAKMSNVDLTDAVFVRTDLANSYFEPRKIAKSVWFGVKGLSEIDFDNPNGVVELRSAMKEGSFREAERALSSALRKYELASAPKTVRVIEEYLFGGLLTDFGARPWSCLKWLVTLIPIFGLPYIPAITFQREGGIWAVIEADPPSTRPTFLRVTSDFSFSELSNSRWYRLAAASRVLFVALYFSAISAFQIGWKEFNVGSWIYRLQPRAYVLRGTGWVRVVSGMQALISLYLLALWALTYFGRPYE